jgi:glycosyltransferase involved in cell wall biosynthesis
VGECDTIQKLKPDLSKLKTALVHHWFLNMSGGEKVCESICELFDSIDLFSILADPSALSSSLKNHSITTSFVQKMPGAKAWHRYYAWLFPLAVESFDLRPYDLVITSDSSTVKGVITQPGTCHICYCHSPMRYAWNMFNEYAESPSSVKRALTSLLMHYLRLWDHSASARVDYFIANSLTVRDRIRKYYRREAKVIYPPCDIDRFQITPVINDYYLFVGRLVAYKHAHIAVESFNRSGKRFKVVGDGPDRNRLKSMAKSNVEILGWVSDDELASLYAGCKALIFPAEEDLGIVPIEAQASGRPVIAFGKGGALETVVPEKTGLYFYEQTPEALNEAVDLFETKFETFDPQEIRNNAERFNKRRFQQELAQYVAGCLNEHAERFRSKVPL